MYLTSKEYSKQVLSNSREWDIYIDITLADGTQLHLTKGDIALGTITLKEGATCSNTIQVGSTYSNSFEFSLVNREGKYTDFDFYRAKVKPYVGLLVPAKGTRPLRSSDGYLLKDSSGLLIGVGGDSVVWQYEYVPLGVFWVLENVKKLSVIPIVCLDRMSLINKVFDFSRIVFPTACSTIFTELVAQCSLEVNPLLVTEVSQLNWRIDSLLTNDPTCRDILAGFGIMLQKNFRFNRFGVLESFWYEDFGSYTNKSTRVGNSSYGDNPLSITGVQLEDAYGNQFSFGTEEYVVTLPSSPIIQGSEMSWILLEAALTKFQNLSCRSSTITYTGNPAIQAGDIVEHFDSAVGTLKLPVMRSVYKLGGTGTLESLGSSEAQQSQESSTKKSMKKAFSQAKREILELKTSIEQTADAITLRVSKAEKAISDNAEEAKKIADTVTEIESSQTTIKQTSESVRIEVDKILRDGAAKVSTSKGFTFDDKGLTISDSSNQLTNTLDEDGMHIKYKDSTMLDATSEGVEAKNLEASTYLIVGGRSRFENMRGSNRTGCFWIGG